MLVAVGVCDRLGLDRLGLAVLLWLFCLIPASCTLLAADWVGSERATEWQAVVLAGIGLRVAGVIAVAVVLSNLAIPGLNIEILTIWAVIAYITVLVAEAGLLIQSVAESANSEDVSR